MNKAVKNFLKTFYHLGIQLPTILGQNRKCTLQICQTPSAQIRHKLLLNASQTWTSQTMQNLHQHYINYKAEAIQDLSALALSDLDTAVSAVLRWLRRNLGVQELNSAPLTQTHQYLHRLQGMHQLRTLLQKTETVPR